ncbi:MAG: hypothetical protein ACFB4J_04855 [Elainellaceae cyanobacterium]
MVQCQEFIPVGLWPTQKAWSLVRDTFLPIDETSYISRDAFSVSHGIQPLTAQ